MEKSSHPVDCWKTDISCKCLVNHVLFCSIAKTLGALTVTQGVFDLKKELLLYSHVVTDKEAVEACAKFAGL